AARQLVGRAASPRRALRRHALGERRACTGPGQSRALRDVPPRPRRSGNRHRWLRGTARGDGRARTAARGRGDGPLAPVPEARALAALALERGPPRRRAREGPGRVRRPEPAVRDPLRRPAGDRRGRRDERDGTSRPRGGLWRGHTTRAVRPPRTHDPRGGGRRLRPRRDGPARARVRREGGGPGRRDGAVSSSRAGTARGVIARTTFWGSLAAPAWR